MFETPLDREQSSEQRVRNRDVLAGVVNQSVCSTRWRIPGHENFRGNAWEVMGGNHVSKYLNFLSTNGMGRRLDYLDSKISRSRANRRNLG